MVWAKNHSSLAGPFSFFTPSLFLSLMHFFQRYTNKERAINRRDGSGTKSIVQFDFFGITNFSESWTCRSETQVSHLCASFYILLFSLFSVLHISLHLIKAKTPKLIFLYIIFLHHLFPYFFLQLLSSSTTLFLLQPLYHLSLLCLVSITFRVFLLQKKKMEYFIYQGSVRVWSCIVVHRLAYFCV